jgi:hypothetical protein
MIKDGYKTTEFWLTAVLFVVNFLASQGVFSPQEQTELQTTVPFIVSGFVIVGYAVSRAISKWGK